MTRCGGGSPRFQVRRRPTARIPARIFVYIGPPPDYTLCPPNVWLNTGDLLEGANPIDTSQLDGGTFYDPYATALHQVRQLQRDRRSGGR